jgi:hypothetical protein
LGFIAGAAGPDRIAFTIPEDRALLPGAYRVKVEQGGEHGMLSDQLLVLPSPRLTSLSTGAVCEGRSDIMLRGSGFLVGPSGRAPGVQIGIADFAPEPSDCAQISTGTTTWSVCETLTARAGDFSSAYGAHAVTIQNPSPFDCATTSTLTLAVTPVPVIERLDPDVLCIEQSNRTLTVQGHGIIPSEPVEPQILITGLAFGAVPLDCAHADAANDAGSTCSSAFTTIPIGAFGDALQPVSFVNQGALSCGSNVLMLAVVPQPYLLDIEPSAVCLGAAPKELELHGFFLEVDDEAGRPVLPSVRFIDMASLEERVVVATRTSSCAPVNGPREAVKSCSSLSVELSPENSSAGDKLVFVSHPPTIGCSSSISPPPIAVRVDPACPR